MADEPEHDDAQWLIEARAKLGEMWGLGRSLSRAEMGRALELSPKYAGSHITKLELPNPAKRPALTGPIKVAVTLMLAGGVPPGMASVVKPGYPRGLAK